MSKVENAIEREIEINAPIGKVWMALTDSGQFGEWFKVDLKSKFVAGKTTKGRNTYKGFEMDMAFHVKDIKPQSYFSYAWTPYPMDTKFDYSKEEPTLVEFFLQPTKKGTHVRVKESGFNKITASRRAEAFKMHSGGWESQLENIKEFVVETK